jgi:hypothetical protein
MLELGSSGSVRGVSSNGHPYRDPRAVMAMDDEPSFRLQLFETARIHEIRRIRIHRRLTRRASVSAPFSKAV